MESIEQERLKYSHIWAQPWYRKISPGFNVAHEALGNCGMKAGETLTDYGCGTGRAGKFFRDNGLWVCGIDICREALEETLDRFIQGCLWELPPEFPITDWAFCADVLEHIPTNYLEVVVWEILNHTRKGGFLKVAHFPNDDLHLSVYPNKWWIEFLSARLPGFKPLKPKANTSTYLFKKGNLEDANSH
jgi:SAM-dependent methyltransferase